MTKKDDKEQSRKKSARITTGFLLIFCSVLVPPISRMMDYYTRNHGYACPDQSSADIIIKDVTLSAYTLLLIAGIMCILPIGDWIKSWRGDNKK